MTETNTIPTYADCMLPLLRIANDDQEHSFGEAVELLGIEFGLSADQLAEKWPSAKYPKFRGRVSWAKTYLTKALLISATSTGRFVITERGRAVVHSQPERIDRQLLSQFAEFREFIGKTVAEVEPVLANETPDEYIEKTIAELNRAVALELLERLKGVTWSFFQDLVVDLLVQMGYGNADTARVVGRTNDGGIDGVIPQDALGLDVVYVQTKRWASSVGSAAVREFAGSLGPHLATKGIIATTSSFPQKQNCSPSGAPYGSSSWTVLKLSG